MDSASHMMVDAFIKERLLISELNAQSQGVVRLSHEAILDRWPRLDRWLQTARIRDVMSMRRRLETNMQHWQEQSKHSDYLLASGLAMEEAKSLLRSDAECLSSDEKEFIVTSIHYNDQISSRVNIRRKIILATFLFLAVASMLFGLNARNSAREADTQRIAAEQKTQEAELQRNQAIIAKNRESEALTLVQKSENRERVANELLAKIVDEVKVLSLDFRQIISQNIPQEKRVPAEMKISRMYDLLEQAGYISEQFKSFSSVAEINEKLKLLNSEQKVIGNAKKDVAKREVLFRQAIKIVEDIGYPLVSGSPTENQAYLSEASSLYDKYGLLLQQSDRLDEALEIFKDAYNLDVQL